jgi:hypothetical protein
VVYCCGGTSNSWNLCEEGDRGRINGIRTLPCSLLIVLLTGTQRPRIASYFSKVQAQQEFQPSCSIVTFTFAASTTSCCRSNGNSRRRNDFHLPTNVNRPIPAGIRPATSAHEPTPWLDQRSVDPNASRPVPLSTT